MQSPQERRGRAGGFPFTQTQALSRPRKKIILCFDGTGNKFSGTDADSNILKIYRMLDRSNGDATYYQPGIGTYVNTRSISHTSLPARLNSWYQKAKDSAIGTSFDEHVMGAYKFLMQAYTSDEDIFFFGFSRGAYVARFLAEMLDRVGLLSVGNEEMARFAWKAFSQWQTRQDGTEEEKKKKAQMYEFLLAFRETFSRPVRRIRFIGLFDTVNSVPRFENAWMQRSKFPYTARSSAKVIRHAVSIDERRAKFRSDLISAPKMSTHRDHHLGRARKETASNGHGSASAGKDETRNQGPERFRRPSRVRAGIDRSRLPSPQTTSQTRNGSLMPNFSSADRMRSLSPAVAKGNISETGSIHTTTSLESIIPPMLSGDDDDDIDEADVQDIEELWFPGCHADLGGGWPLGDSEESALSHGPLVWMVREAQHAGLDFDEVKMRALRCCDDVEPLYETEQAPNVPKVEVTKPVELFRNPPSDHLTAGWAPGLQPDAPKTSAFHQNLHTSATKGVLHDCLEFNNGLGWSSVISWKIMEYLPFRRMDLTPDGSWEAISWPLPMGEVRDIPENAKIHHSAIRRMEANERYRPGNLIVGGGGRGMRRPPKELGIGQWRVLKNEGDPVGEVLVREGPSVDKEMKSTNAQ